MTTAQTLAFLDKLEQSLIDNCEETTLLIAAIHDYKREHTFPENSYHLDSWNMDAIEWLPCEGPKGPYEKAVYQDSRDFRLCLRDLIACNNKMERDGYFLWKFDRENIIGRKRIT
jgi:hypothetical protein